MIASLASIPLVMTLGNSMLIPVLPTIEKQLHITLFQSSLLITMYSVVAIIFIPISGYISDRIGRKKVIIPSLLLAAIGGLISGWASWKMNEPYGMIVAGRMLQGLGAAGAFPIVLPLVGDLFPNDSEASSCLGTIETANTFGKVLSPILGAMFASIAWFLPFFTFPLFCAISLAMMLFFYQISFETGSSSSISAIFTKCKNDFSKGRALAICDFCHWRFINARFICVSVFLIKPS